MNWLTDDQAMGAALLLAAFSPWLIPVVAPALLKVLDRRTRNAERRRARGTTTHWLASSLISEADYDAIARRDADRERRAHRRGGRA